MICIARTFGAPETVPAGKQARRRSKAPTPSCSSPTTSETRWVTCEKRSGSMKRSTWTLPASHTRERSFRPRSTSITCSARSFSDSSSRSASPGPGAVVPAIGLRLARRPSTLTSVSGEEPIRATSPSSSRNVYGEGLTRRSARYRSSALADGRPLGPLRDDDLEGVACADVLLRALDRALVLEAAGVPPGRCGRPLAARELGRRRVEQRPQLVGVAAEHLGEAARMVEAHQRVGDDEPALRQVRPVGGELHRRLERRDVVVAEVADDRRRRRLRLGELDRCARRSRRRSAARGARVRPTRAGTPRRPGRAA